MSQVLSVIVVTVGVIFTTLSSHQSQKTADSSTLDTTASRYLMGIGILTLALVLSGFLGVVQDTTYASYAKHTSAHARPKQVRLSATVKPIVLPNVWEESMFYLHFLSLPMFFFVRRDITMQANALFSPYAGTTTFNIPLAAVRFTLPAVLPALLANALTQLLCVAGVNRLTTRVPALTVTLILVVRKAVSLVFSVMLFEGADVAWGMLWSGAFLVFAGTVVYTVSTAPIVKSEEKKNKNKKE
jgi:solute carrier family 35 (UDP-xylose/UDP-N-acetylglucosamine transporter), member B4